jgi:hypothetical protein
MRERDGDCNLLEGMIVGQKVDPADHHGGDDQHQRVHNRYIVEREERDAPTGEVL